MAISKFTNFRLNGAPLFRGFASDGEYQVELELSFEPPFQLGEEFDLLGAKPRETGECPLARLAYVVMLIDAIVVF